MSDLAQLFYEGLKQLEQEKLKILAMGSLTDYAAYREQCGVLQGLREAREVFVKARKADEAFGDFGSDQ